MKIVFIGYNYLPEYTSPEEWVNHIKPSAMIMESLAKDHTVCYAGQIGWKGNYTNNGVQYIFTDPGKRTRIPSRLHSIIKKLQPDIAVVPGFHFPLQVMQLRYYLGKKTKVILEYHADKVPGGMKKQMQRIADRFVDAYHFTSAGNATEWLKAGIIRNATKCFVIVPNTSTFKPLDRNSCREFTEMRGLTFLWVGNLTSNKDPLTVLKGFKELLTVNPEAELHMIYRSTQLLSEVRNQIYNSEMGSSVFLHGAIPHEQLGLWFSGADFYISGSHREGGSIALLEAMSCGCIPIVTSIPAALQVTDHGRFGLHYEAGNKDELVEKLMAANVVDRQKWSTAIIDHFNEELSADAIAKRFEKLWPLP